MVKKFWLNTALTWLLIAALVGLLLRWMTFQPTTGINYNYLLHAHSHIAILGWVFTALFSLIIHHLLDPQQQDSRIYKWQFILFQVANMGMLMSFPFTGYAPLSILFSTFHILISYWFCWKFFKDLRSSDHRNKLSGKFIQAAIFFMILSSLGPFSLAPIIKIAGQGSELYYNAIYFYLHFQYNGWFSFAVLGVFFKMLEEQKINFDLKKATLFFKLMLYACVPAYLLSVLWIHPPVFIFGIAILSAFVQGIALCLLFTIIKKIRSELRLQFSNWVLSLFYISIVSFFIKILLQLISSIPYFANLAYDIRSFIIAYLHLTLIGFVSLFIFGAFIHNKALRLSRSGIFLLLIGFISSELLLFGQGMFFWFRMGTIPYYNPILFYISLLLPLSVTFFLGRQLFSKP